MVNVKVPRCEKSYFNFSADLYRHNSIIKKHLKMLSLNDMTKHYLKILFHYWRCHTKPIFHTKFWKKIYHGSKGHNKEEGKQKKLGRKKNRSKSFQVNPLRSIVWVVQAHCNPGSRQCIRTEPIPFITHPSSSSSNTTVNSKCQHEHQALKVFALCFLLRQDCETVLKVQAHDVSPAHN